MAITFSVFKLDKSKFSNNSQLLNIKDIDKRGESPLALPGLERDTVLRFLQLLNILFAFCAEFIDKVLPFPIFSNSSQFSKVLSKSLTFPKFKPVVGVPIDVIFLQSLKYLN